LAGSNDRTAHPGCCANGIEDIFCANGIHAISGLYGGGFIAFRTGSKMDYGIRCKVPASPLHGICIKDVTTSPNFVVCGIDRGSCREIADRMAVVQQGLNEVGADILDEHQARRQSGMRVS